MSRTGKIRFNSDIVPLLLAILASSVLTITTFSWIKQMTIGPAIDEENLNNNSKHQQEEEEETRKHIPVIQDLVCKDFKRKGDWSKLCSGGFPMAAAQKLLDGEDVNIVQIGAHVGFEKNDPIARGISTLLDEVAAVLKNENDKRRTRQRFHWTFVEPSPPNFHRLKKNLLNHSAVCDMKAINAGVVSDFFTEATTRNMPFYSLSETIDPETGYDSLSGKTLPHWITQVSSFSIEPLKYNKRVFRRKGLVFEDYVVVTNVTTLPFSKLMEQAFHDSGVEGKSKAAKNDTPLLVLIDTEGFDCDIIKGISPSSTFIPEYLVFEYKSCDYKHASEHLKKNLGYHLYSPGAENIVGLKISH